MHRPVRALVVAVLALLGAAAGGCASTPEESAPPRTVSAPAGDAPEGTAAEGGTAEGATAEGAPAEGAPAKTTESPSPRRPRKATGAERAGQYALAVPENIVWLPWKMIGGGIKGASDGVQAGFDKGRMPLLGTIFAPVNLVVGLATGLVEGLLMSPGLVGPDDDFGRALSLPTKRETSIWWYPQ